MLPLKRLNAPGDDPSAVLQQGDSSEKRAKPRMEIDNSVQFCQKKSIQDFEAHRLAGASRLLYKPSRSLGKNNGKDDLSRI
jgi:hypothetical protein